MAAVKTAFYLEIWRKAFHEPQAIPCLDVKEAEAIRLKMYVAARPYRNLDPKVVRRGKEWVTTESPGVLDPDLRTKILATEIVIDKHEDGSATLRVRPEWMNERLMRISAATGIPFGPQESDALESQQRIMERLAHPEREEAQGLSYADVKAQNSQKAQSETLIDDEYERKLGDDLLSMDPDSMYGDD